jgi:hypothetical protein
MCIVPARRKGFADVAGEGGAPAERHRPEQAQRPVFIGQTERERVVCDQFKKRSVSGGETKSARATASRWWNRF